MLRGLNDSKGCAAAASPRARARDYGAASLSYGDRRRERRRNRPPQHLLGKRACDGTRDRGAGAARPSTCTPTRCASDRIAGPQEPLIKGDALCAVVSAASIVAKVYRDDLLAELDRRRPALRLCRPQRLRDARPHRGAARPRARACTTARAGRGSKRRSSNSCSARTPTQWTTVKNSSTSWKGREGEDAGRSLPERVAATGSSRATCASPAARSTSSASRARPWSSSRSSAATGAPSARRSSAVDARKRRKLRMIASDYAQIVAPNGTGPVRHRDHRR